jgi:cell division protein FtsA
MKKEEPKIEIKPQAVVEERVEEETIQEQPKAAPVKQPEMQHESTGDKIKRGFFDKYIDRIKEFLDNAE